MGKSRRKDVSDSDSDAASRKTTKKQRKNDEKTSKIELKKLLKQQEEGQLESQMKQALGYSNSENPFGDSNLNQKFVWGKKIKADMKAGLTKEDVKKRENEKKSVTMSQLDDLAKRRKEREIEKLQREEEKEMMQKQQDYQSLDNWEEKEGQFQLDQAKRRAIIRLKEGRAKPIDVLAINLSFATDNVLAEELDQSSLQMDLTLDPFTITQNLPLISMEALVKDIELYKQLETDERNREFWSSMAIIVDAEVDALKSEDGSVRYQGVTKQIMEQMDTNLSTKSLKKLLKLEKEVNSKLSEEGPKDVEYWECLLKKLDVWKSKAKVKAMYEFMVKERGDIDINDGGVEKKLTVLQAYNAGASSTSGGDKVVSLIDDEEDKKIKVVVGEDGMSLREREFIQQSSLGMEEGEEIFQGESTMNQNYQWEDKFRPRKPRYFNRVHTGYEWNKYNQTHYDTDNPPPKVVQAYKFNIFYPDLVDPSQTPSFKLERGVVDGTRVLRFIGGPPYEDVAFRIVDREWEQSYKRGFKSTFENGVLQLYFSFKRNYYRR